jgi:hypothetical protein
MVELFKNDYMDDLIDDLNYLLENNDSLDDLELECLNDHLNNFKTDIQAYVSSIKFRNESKIVNNGMTPTEYIYHRFQELVDELLLDDLPSRERKMLKYWDKVFRKEDF